MAVFSVAVSSRHPLILFVTRGVVIPLPAQLLPMVAQTNKGFNGSIKRVQRTGAGRFARGQTGSHRRQARVADLCVGSKSMHPPRIMYIERKDDGVTGPAR